MNKKIQKEISEKIAKISKKTDFVDFNTIYRTASFALEVDKNLEDFFIKNKKEFINILSTMGKLYKTLPTELNWEAKIMYLLGFFPRNGKKIWITTGLLYYIIKQINPNIALTVFNDGSLYGYIEEIEDQKNNFIFQAHMDVVILNNSLYREETEENLDYGVYGVEPKAWVEKKENEWYILKNNDKAVLGADDGKGIVSILRIIKDWTKLKKRPRITFLLTACEESPFGFSIKHFVKNNKNIERLFPHNYNTKIYFNLDSYSGTEIDTYTKENNNINDNQKTNINKIILEHEKYLSEEIKRESTQAQAWINPPSEVLWIKDIMNEKIQNCLFISCASDSIKPHSIDENIQLNEIKKFNNWLIDIVIKTNK